LTIHGDLLKRDVSPKKALNLLVGLRLNSRPGKEMYTLVESLLEESAALDADGGFPLQWIFSVRPLLEHTSRDLDNLLVEIKARSASRRDRVVAAGFQGAVHPLLTAEELDKELAWCRSHTAAAGFAPLFGAAPAAIMPDWPDPWRELGGGAYSRHGFKMLGLPQDPARAYRFRRGGNDGRALLFSYIPLPAGGRDELARRLRGLPAAVMPRENVLFLLFDTASLEAGRAADGKPRPLLRPLLSALGERYAVTPASLADPELFAGAREAPGALDYLPIRADPIRRRSWLQAEPLRRKADRGDEDYRRILELLSAGPDPPPPAAEKTAAPDQRVLDASMKGEVVLSGERFDACFCDGRLATLSFGGRPLLDAGPAQVYLELAGIRHDYFTESAFSFQGPGEHGLRAVLKLRLPRAAAPGAESRLLVDCYFKEDCPDLLLDFQLAYPELEDEAEITRIAPYELPLLAAAAEQDLRVLARYPDHGQVKHRFAPVPAGTEEELRLLSGSEFILDCGGRRLALRFAGSPRVGLLEFCRRRRGGRQFLFANLNGSYRPTRGGRYSGIRERFSFRLGLAP
jgi:hypothetical protein